ncbi:MAG: CDP-glucose 4,6-dehydratase [Candidatus Omnitrophica bacterium]|nr:CDP-glucose 4,6-dehydratase [Candidatus Omnitrophota bacterium]
MFLKCYKDKRVLVTGHTGFKGAWLSLWLLELEAKVAGFSIDVPTEPSAFEAMELSHRLQDFRGDVRRMKELRSIFKEFRPQIIFHLAAQPFVRESLREPKRTIETNVMGTVNVLECVRESSIVEAVVIITSDQCYENVDCEWGYREIDRLGGDDPQKASKTCSELICQAYSRSYFGAEGSTAIATARAGYVIGGGDWAKHRLVPDCIKAWYDREVPVINHPEYRCPWQHVFEPLSGYLWLGALLTNQRSDLNGESFNFGSEPSSVRSVEELIESLIARLSKGRWVRAQSEDIYSEPIYRLNCEKALNQLQWVSVLSYDDMVDKTVEWYKQFYKGGTDMYSTGRQQIMDYVRMAAEKKLAWTFGKEYEKRSRRRAAGGE